MLAFKGSWLDGQDYHQTPHHEHGSDQSDDKHTPTACGKSAPDDPMLTLKISVESHEEDNDGDGEKC